jgi:hypothetical protein
MQQWHESLVGIEDRMKNPKTGKTMSTCNNNNILGDLKPISSWNFFKEVWYEGKKKK